MRTTWMATMVVTGLVMSAGCANDVPTDSEALRNEPALMKFARSEWSEPVNLGPTINTSANEQGGTLSPNGLALYFNSNRPGGLGANDLWVAHRDCEACPWRPPVNLGAPMNSAANDGQVTFSTDPHVVFFNSGRPGGHGSSDLYMARRAEPTDDFGWGTPVNLGPDVNTSDNEAGAEYVEREDGRDAVLYFSRGNIMQQLADIYAAPVTRDGQILGPAAAVSELNVAAINDAGLTVRQDGREIIFWSNRDSPPGLVRGDLFVSTRHNVHHPWSTPTNLGPPVNSELNEISASLSSDGRTLIFVSDRPGFGGFDLWMSTRTPSGR